MVSPMRDDVIIRSIINIFFNNLLIDTLSSLIIIRLNLINSSSKGLVSIELSYIRFYFELYVLKSFISIIFSMIILF